MALIPSFLEATLSSLRTQLNLFGQYKVLLDSLPQLQMPTLVVWGTDDLIFPVEQAKDAVSRLQKGHLALIPDESIASAIAQLLFSGEPPSPGNDISLSSGVDPQVYAMPRFILTFAIGKLKCIHVKN